MNRFALLLASLLLAACTTLTADWSGPSLPAHKPNPLAHEVNRYRAARGLTPIAISPSLTQVAEAHVADLEANYRKATACNMHSWSSRGNWSACCYTPDHARAECMWNKPGEISKGKYTAPGYEIVAHFTDSITPSIALSIWKNSPSHHALIVNGEPWAARPWRALGAAYSEHYAVVWVGESLEPSAN